MLSSILALSTLALTVSARIGNMTFPSTGNLGETLKINVTDENYIQQWYDLGVLFGFQSKEYACGTCVGEEAWYENLYGISNPKFKGTNGTFLPNYTINVPVPPYLNTSLDYLLVAAVPYVAGASGVTGFRYFNSSIVLTNITNYDNTD